MKDDTSEISRFRNDNHALLARTNRLELELAQRNKDVAILQKALRDSRQRPMKSLKRKLEFKILRSLSEGATWLPEDMRRRFAQSAKKRDPKRDDLAQLKKPQTLLSYSAMIERWESLRSEKENEKNLRIQNFPLKPRISILVPVYNPDPNLLVQMLDSVVFQSYPNWELCVADDCSTDSEVGEVLRRYEKKYEQIKVVFREENGHISRASNSALEIATGEFVALLDHDDLLDRDALFFIVSEINKNPKVKIIYTDEDKVSVNGRRYDPCFKPDFNKELLLSNNYISHFGVYQKELIQKIGGFRAGYEGAQDYDLVLRASSKCSSSEICHISKVLYSWRASPGSTALEASTKSYTHDAGLRALKSYMVDQGHADLEVVSGAHPNMYKVEWKPGDKPLVSLLMPTRDRLNITKVAVESVLNKTTYDNFELIIIDNGSVEKETLEWLDELRGLDERVRVLRDPSPFNYSALNNKAVEAARGTIIGLLNNDIEIISPHWLTEMVSLAIREDVGCVGAKLYYPNDTIQHAGVVVGIGGVAGHVFSEVSRRSAGYAARLCNRQEYTAVTAACLIVKRDIYEAVGGLNEESLAVAFNDVDFCLRVKAMGYRNLWTPYAEVYHYESISRGIEDTPEKISRFSGEKSFMLSNWKTRDFRDPAYNVNLTLKRTDCSFAEPVWEM
jgi:glycosyltransferase involved in cell wall biosynthesis